ncbi:MAG TPA: ATP-binding protein [Anaerolineaceae bacterium]|jgi:predicted AAA+ superfamily ATPase|nr:ATP-binding protein [Anaerolineaceae bacterium]HNZ14263.1 ATP-binding protein [Anaerolineaceae bacterium]HOD03584.1 ATP-binding protein [Anaerolineaceae bacterium]HOG80151.1 ATP-binding protein [Anaerolineaceae bacterium]HQF62664.1 ATP-binding protein [Anaerolineaceae bacterium]
MINRPFPIDQIHQALRRSPITALLGPRQCGKTTLARVVAQGQPATFFDLESVPDQRRLQNPNLVLADLTGLVVLDEIQSMPEIFNVLRVRVDRPDNQARYLILGSASPLVVKHISESLAGRVEFVELSGLRLDEVGISDWQSLWLSGGFPRSYLASNETDSLAWREGFIRTFLERDIPQLGINIPAAAMRRFWMMLAHYHGQTWNASELGRSLGINDKTVRYYLDILTGTYMVRQLQPWYENLNKRQVKAPKVYFRDSGLLHALLGISDWNGLLGHPKVGASWEGFVIEQVLQLIQPPTAYYWGVHGSAELDLFYILNGKRYGIEVKFSEAPEITASMHVALQDLKLDHLWVIHPGSAGYPVHERITVLPISQLAKLQSV